MGVSRKAVRVPAIKILDDGASTSDMKPVRPRSSTLRKFFVSATVASLLLLASGTKGYARHWFRDDDEKKEREREKNNSRQTRESNDFRKNDADRASALSEEQREVIEEEIEEAQEKARFDQPDEAMKFYMLQRTAGKPLDYGLYLKAKDHIRYMPQAIGDITSWTALGPGNIGGRTRALLVHPTTPATMYAAGVAGGIWKTTNGGTTWNPLDDFMANLAVCSMVFERQGSASVNPATIYAGTGEGFFNIDAVRGAGIFKSTDSGATWTQLSATNTSDFYYVNKLAASPNDANVIYAATRTGIWKTTDGGTNWSRVLRNDGLGGTSGTSVLTISGLCDVVVRTDLGTDNLLVHNGTSQTDGIYRSTDAGATWSRVLTVSGMGRASLAFAPSNQAVAYALCADRLNGNRLLNVYRSADGGGTWTARVTSPASFDQTSPNWLLLTNPLAANYNPCFGATNVVASQGWYDNTIAVAPHNENVVFAGGIDWFRSDDGGANWGLASYWWTSGSGNLYCHADQHVLAFDPGWNGTSNQTLYVGNDGGLFKTANALAATASGSNNGICENGTCLLSWATLNNNYQVTQFYHGLPFPNGSVYFGGTQDNGTIEGTNGGGINGWISLNGGDGGWVAFNPGNTATVFLEIQNKNLRRSTTGGLSAADIVNGAGQVTETSANFPFIVPYRMDPSNSDVLWYGGRSPWRCNNASSASSEPLVTWTQGGAQLIASGSISAWGIAPTNGNIVYVGANIGSPSYAGKIYKTTSGLTSTSSTTWTDVTPTLPSGAYISWIEVDPSDSTGNTVYATQSYFSSGNHVYQTTNGGTSWTNITNNLPDLPAMTLAIQPNHPTNLYVGTDLGVFVSKNTGGSWAQMNTPGFANVSTSALSFLNEYQLFAFTHGRGAYRAALEGNPTPTPTATPTATRSSTRSPTRTATPSPTRSKTSTPTRSSTRTATRSSTRSATRTASLTATRTRTASLTATRSATISPTRSSTRTGTRSATLSPTRSATLSPTRTASLTPTPTRTGSPSPTRSATTSPTTTASLSPTRTATVSGSGTITPSPTRSATPTPSSTFTPSPTRTASLTPTPTDTATLTPTISPTATLSPTRSATTTPSSTSTPSATQTATPSPSSTSTPLPTATRTSTASPTESATPTPNATRNWEIYE